MPLEELLSEEDKEYIFNELERERLIQSILKLYEAAISCNDRSIVRGAYAALDIVSYVSVKDFLCLFSSADIAIPYDDDYLNHFYKFYEIMPKLLRSSAVVNPESYLWDYFRQSGKDYPLFTIASIPEELGSIDPNNKEKLEQLIIETNKLKMGDIDIENKILCELLNVTDVLFLRRYKKVLEKYLTSLIPNREFGDTDFIESLAVKKVLQRLMDISPNTFITFFHTQINRRSKHFETYSKDETEIERDCYTCYRDFREVLGESLRYFLVSVLRRPKFPDSDNPLSLFLKKLVSNVPFSKKETPEIIESVKTTIIQNKSIDYQKLNEIVSFGEVKSLKELLECYFIESNYALVSILGEGKSGKTYKVYSPELKKYFALKIINDKFNPREAELMAKLKGEDLENIVQIHDAGKHIAKVDEKDKYAIVMEYIEGEDLAEIIPALKGSLHEVLDVGVQLFNGIQSLRNYRITHRDLNPKNIKVDKYGHVKILDFGIATDEENPAQVDARRYGVPNNKSADDLFSLGLLLFEMYEGYHLIVPRTKEMGSSTHADKNAEKKKELLDKHGKISGEYEHLLNQKIGSLIRLCLEGHDLSDIKKELIQLQPDTRFYFMRKYQLVNELVHNEELIRT